MPTGQDLVLGTLFKGRVDATFETAVKRLENALKGMNTAFKGFNQQADRSRQKVREFASAVDKASASPKKMNTSMEMMNKQISNARSGYERFLGALKVTAAYSVAYRSMAAITNSLRAGVEEIVDYDQALKNLQAITGATSTQVNSMGDVILDVAKTTKFSTTEIAQGMVLLGQAGFSAEESMQAIRATADLASGTLSDMATVADLVTTSIRAFSLNASEASRVADVMGNAVNRSKLTVDKLRVAFNFVGASAAQAGLSIEETASAMMVLANNGLRASTIGTGLRQVLARLIAPSKKIREEMEKYGIQLEKINPSVVGFETAIHNLSSILIDGETGLVNMGKAFQLFGLRGAQAAAITVKAYTSGEWDTAMENAMRVGTAAEMAKIQLQGLAAQFKNLQDRAGVLAVSIGEAGVKGALQGVVTILRELVSAADVFVNSALGGIIVKAGVAATAIIGLGLAFKGLRIAMQAIHIGKFLTSPLGIAITVISTAIGVLQQWNSASERARVVQLKTAAELDGTIAKLHSYSENLKILHESQKETAPQEYEQQLKRLANEFPKLTKKVNLATASFEEIYAVLQEIKRVEAEKKLAEYAEIAGKTAYEIRKERVEHELLADTIEFFSKALTGNWNITKGWTDSLREGGKAVANANDYVKQVIATLKVEVEQKRMSAAEAKKWAIENVIANKEISASIDNDLLPAFFRYLDQVGKAKKVFASTPLDAKDVVDETKKLYEGLYSELDALAQADLAAVIRATEKKVAAFKEFAEKSTISEEDRAAAVRQIWDREIWDYQLKLEEQRKGEELTATEILAIWEEFVKKYQVTGQFRIDTENAILAEIRKENDKHSQELLKAKNQLDREMLRATKEYKEQEKRILYGDIEDEIQAKRTYYKRLAQMDELAVAQGNLTQEKADKAKRERERAFLKFIMEQRKKALDFSIETYGKDSEEYRDALNAKIKAEEDYRDQVHEIQLEKLKEQTEALQDTNETNESNFSDSMRNMEKEYDKTVQYVKRNKITVDADITPAQAALSTLLEEYRSKIAGYMALYAEQVSQGMLGISGQIARGYAEQIKNLMDQANRIKNIFGNNPILGAGGGVSNTITTPEDVTGGTTPAGSSGGSTSTVGFDWAPAYQNQMNKQVPWPGTRPGTNGSIQWNFNLPTGNESLEVVDENGQARDTINNIGSTLQKMGLSYG